MSATLIDTAPPAAPVSNRSRLAGRVLTGIAVATQLRVDSPLFSHVLFPIYVAALV